MDKQLSDDEEVIKDDPGTENFLKSIYAATNDGLMHQASLRTMIEKTEKEMLQSESTRKLNQSIMAQNMSKRDLLSTIKQIDDTAIDYNKAASRSRQNQMS